MNEYTLKVSLPAVQNTVQIPLQHIVDMLAMGLMGIEAVQDTHLKIPHTFFRMSPADNNALSVEDAKIRFKTWILSAAMRDFIEVVSVFLEEIQLACSALSLVKELSLTDDFVVATDDMATKFRGWQGNMETDRKKFHRLGFPDKIDAIKAQYGPSIVSPLIANILSMNTARNCLVHRSGIISEKDVNCDGGLLVEWRKLEFNVDGEAKGQNAQVLAGQTIKIQYASANKLFKLGNQITFTTDEVNEICLTCTLFAIECVKNVEIYYSNQGVPMSPDIPFIGRL